MRDDQVVHAHFKLGDRAHMRSLRAKGEMYMRSLDYYRQIEDDQERGDPYEGDSILFQPPRLASLQIGGHTIKPTELAGPVRLSNGEDRACVVFCMGSISGPVVDRHLRLGAPLVDERCLAFGDTAIVVTNPDVFFDRLRSALHREGLSSEGRLVEYLSIHVHHGDWGPFRKDHRLEHQQEWRLAVRNPTSDPLVLRLGSLLDCTTEMSSETLVRTAEVAVAPE